MFCDFIKRLGEKLFSSDKQNASADVCKAEELATSSQKDKEFSPECANDAKSIGVALDSQLLPENVTNVFSDWCYFSRYENAGRYGVLEEKSATMAVPAIYDEVAIMYDESGALIEKIVNIKENGKWRLYQIGSGFVDNPEFKKIGHLREGKHHVSFLDKLHGFIDEQGEIVLPFVYADCKSFSDGLCAVKFIPAHGFDPNNGWGYIDHQGETVITGQYGDACKFHDGYARVQAKEPAPYDIRALMSGLEGRWGIIDKSGNEILPCKHNLDSISRQLKILRHPVQQKKEISYSPASNRIAISRNHVFVALKSGKVICLDSQGHNMGEKIPTFLAWPKSSIGQRIENFNVVTTWKNVKQIAAGFDYAVALTSDGKIFTTGNASEFTQSRTVESWAGVKQISACHGHTAAITESKQILIATGNGGWESSPNYYGQHLQNISEIKKVAVSWLHAAVLRNDGTVVVVGEGDYCNAGNVKHWCNIIDIDVFGCYYSPIQTVGLTSEGKILTTNEELQKEVQQWSDIISVSCGDANIVALDRNGKVFACGRNDCGQCDIANWPKMLCVKTGFFRTVGIDREGFIWLSGIGKTKYNFYHTAVR